MNETIEKLSPWDYENGYFQTAPYRRHELFMNRQKVFALSADLPGDIVECGVFKGVGLAQWAAFRQFYNVTQKKIWAFDTFDRFPESEGEEQAHIDYFIERAGNPSSLEQIEDLIRRLNIDNIELGAGLFPDSLKMLTGRITAISFLHLDFDLYEPTLAALKHFVPLMPPGAVVAFDDYVSFKGEKEAVDEYFGRRVRIQGHRPAYLVLR